MSNNILDLDEFMERVQDDKELLLELLDIYVEDFNNKRKLLQEAVNDKNYEQIRNIAHSLKGASGNISAKEMRIILLQIEEMGQNSDISNIGDSLFNMDKQFEVLLGKINEIKQQLSE